MKTNLSLTTLQATRLLSFASVLTLLTAEGTFAQGLPLPSPDPSSSGGYGARPMTPGPQLPSPLPYSAQSAPGPGYPFGAGAPFAGNNGMPPGYGQPPGAGLPPGAAGSFGPAGPQYAPVPVMHYGSPQQPLLMRDLSWIYIDQPPPPQKIKVQDGITIEIDEKAEVIANSRFSRQRQGSYQLTLKDFVKLGDNMNFEKAASTQPGIEGSLSNRMQTTGQITDTEGISFKIGATVTDILPNGTLVVEARREIISNQDRFEYRLSGKVPASALSARRTARSEDMIDVLIERKLKGKLFDSTKVNWATRILDIIMPF